jgi:group I intron endonuclease
MIGIYKITNTTTGKIYIGSSINVDYRIKQHFKCLRGNYHRNSHLQLSFNKHKEISFVWDLICECDKNELLKKETEYILKYKSFDRKIGYNILINAEHSRLGVKHSQETKNKISENKKGIKLNEIHKEKVLKNLINGSSFTAEQKINSKIKKSKFKEKDIDEIVKLYNLGKTQREITDIFECSKTTTNKLFKELFETKKLKKRKNGI